MPEIILHQYVNSPFSEKIRKIFAHKKISWRSVEQPVIMPKPKLIPLTGGYRRIPVLQIGADVWSDTGIIIRKIDELRPEPTIYPNGLTAAAETMNQFADRRFFWSTTPVIFEKLAAVVPKEFIEDRSKMMDDLSCKDTETERNRLVSVVVNGLLPLLVIGLGNDRVFSFFDELPNFGIKVDDVLVGPF